MPKMTGYVKTLEIKGKDKDKNKNLISFCIDDEKQVEKYKNIWNKIEDFKNIELNVLSVYYIQKSKIKRYSNEVYINFFWIKCVRR